MCRSESEGELTIQEIDRELKERLQTVYYDDNTYLTEVIDQLILKSGSVSDYLYTEVKSAVDFLSDDLRTSMTALVDAFGTPEALVSYLVNAPEGQEGAMLDLMQVLITRTFERGL